MRKRRSQIANVNQAIRQGGASIPHLERNFAKLVEFRIQKQAPQFCRSCQTGTDPGPRRKEHLGHKPL
jgi:hypothetical protein